MSLRSAARGLEERQRLSVPAGSIRLPSSLVRARGVPRPTRHLQIPLNSRDQQQPRPGRLPRLTKQSPALAGGHLSELRPPSLRAPRVTSPPQCPGPLTAALVNRGRRINRRPKYPIMYIATAFVTTTGTSGKAKTTARLGTNPVTAASRPSKISATMHLHRWLLLRPELGGTNPICLRRAPM